MHPNAPSRCCRCHSCATLPGKTSPGFGCGFSRREFCWSAATLTMGAMGLAAWARGADAATPSSDRRPPPRPPLKVQPVLTYHLPQRREATSWREWGGIQTESDAAAERSRIQTELARMSRQAEFPLVVLPVVMARDVTEAETISKGPYDVLVAFAAGGSGKLLEALAAKGKWNLMFLRHEPGPVYLWYEIAHPRFLRKTVDAFGQPGVDVEDVVVDRFDELLVRLRALNGLKRTLNQRIVAIGGAGGWGAGGRTAPAIAREIWKLDIRDFPYSDLAPRIQKARRDPALMSRCREAARHYLGQSGTTLQTTRPFVDNAFVLREVFLDLMNEAQTDAITVNSCMGTIMPMAETTACLVLSLLNDDGYMAFCESDFVVIPSGLLLHHIAGKPVFLNDPTYPHANTVTLAHCTAPRRLDGRHLEKAKIMTHFESDYGAAPKVEMRLGQTVTNLVPDFANRKWVGFRGTITANPFLDICRSQIDVHIQGDTTNLLREMQGFHWMTCYGDYLPEIGYALNKLGVQWHNLSASQAT